MEPPKTSVPPAAVECEVCSDTFDDGNPYALVRQYNTRVGSPDWQYIWVCYECAKDLLNFPVS